MTDQEIIQALIARDNRVTQDYLFEQCIPLFMSIIRRVFDYEVDYDEFVNELYLYLMENDAARLKQFEGRSSLFLWLKTTATHFFVKKRNQLIDDTSREPLYNQSEDMDDVNEPMAQSTSHLASLDIERLLAAMPNKRYVAVLRRLLLDEVEPEQVAHEMNITTDNLYNIKRRAMLQLMQVALRDIRQYEKR